MMSSQLEGEEREAVMAEVALLARSLVANDGGATLRKIRYAAEGNPHNTLLATKAPQAWAVWQEEMVWEMPVVYADRSAEPVHASAYLAQKIVTDGHVDAAVFPLLVQVLNHMSTVQAALDKLPVGKTDAHPHPELERQLLQALKPGATPAQVAQRLPQLPGGPPFEQLARDLADLKNLLTAPPPQTDQHQTLRARISSQPEDLFLIGTEVIGSCQNVNGSASLNKALPGFALGGHYLSAQVNKDGGALMSRRMLRLMWSEPHQKPVIYVEREYANPGVPPEIKEAVLTLVRHKAERMGALLAVAHGDFDNGVPIGDLQVAPNPRAFEYVDGLRGIEHQGDYVIENAVVLSL
jgi:hypothetical protein